MAITQFLFLVALVTSSFIAWRFGGRDERTAAFAIVAAAVLTPILTSKSYAGPEYGLILVDSLLLLALMGVALGARSFWPLWAAGFQLVALLVHLASAIVPHMLPAAYATTLAVWAYMVLASLALGTWLERQSGTRIA